MTQYVPHTTGMDRGEPLPAAPHHAPEDDRHDAPVYEVPGYHEVGFII